MKNKIIFIIIIFFVFTAAGCSLLPKEPDIKKPGKEAKVEKMESPDEVVFGFNGDQSSSSIAGLGLSAREGFELAVDEINGSGGILGKKIKAVILDDKADKDLSKKNMEKLINEDRALAVIGPTNSASALNWLDLAQKNETIVIVPIATASEITQRYSHSAKNYIFRITALDDDQIRIYVSWLIKKTNNGKIAIINDTTSYGTQGAKNVVEVLSRWGKTPVFTSTFFGNNDSIESLAGQITQAKNSGADAIIFFSYPDSTAKLMKAAEKIAGYHPILVGTTGNIDKKFWNLSGPLASKLTFVSGKFLDLDDAKIAFKQKLKNKFGHETYSLAPAMFAYDAVNLLKASIEKTGSFDRPAVQEGLENIEGLAGITKYFQKPFSKENHEGINIRDMYLARWENGKIIRINEDIESLEIK
jgi:branched-chain amino acid transport system substrate-binding protein